MTPEELLYLLQTGRCYARRLVTGIYRHLVLPIGVKVFRIAASRGVVLAGLRADGQQVGDSLVISNTGRSALSLSCRADGCVAQVGSGLVSVAPGRQAALKCHASGWHVVPIAREVIDAERRAS